MPAGISLSDFYYILPEIVLTAGALVVLVADVLLPRGSRALVWVTLAAIGATLASLAPFGSTHVEVARGLMAVDRFALFFKIIFLVAAAMTVLMSVRYLEIEGVSPGEYYFLILCSTLGMMIMAGGIDLITIFIGLETMAVSFYILAGFIKPNQRSNEAAVKYFLLGAFSLGILLYGMSLLYGLSGTTNLRPMAAVFAGQERDPRLVLAVILLVAGIGFKIAAVPFHMWAPDVYEGAPTPVTAFLSVGSKAASFAMLLRIFLEGLPAMNTDWRLLFEALAIVTMTVGNLAALTQSNLKRMLAYSSIAHAGYVLLGMIAVGLKGSVETREYGLTAVLLYLLIYTFGNIGAFTLVIALRREQVAGDRVADFAGLSRRAPWAAFAMLVFLLSLAGIPATAGFIGKWFLFGAAIKAGYAWLAVVAVINSAISLYYYIRVVVNMYIRAPEDAERFAPSWGQRAALLACIAFTLFFGIYPQPIIAFAEKSILSLAPWAS